MNKDFRDFYKNKKVLVTGNTGFKGSWISAMLLELGSAVIGYALDPNTEPNLFNVLQLKNKIKHYKGDIADFEKLMEVIKKEKPEIVFHMAAQPLVRDSYDDPLYTYRTNAIGTANVLQAIKEAGCVKSAVIITTDKVYENREKDWDFQWAYRENDALGGYDPYSSSKACAEIITKAYINSFFNPDSYGKTHKTLICSARAGNVIGGGDWSKDRLVPDMVKSVLKENIQLVIRSPKAIRPWQHALEPIYGYMLLAKKLYSGEKQYSGAWNFGPNEENFVAVEDLTKKAIKILNKGSYKIKEDSTKHETGILRLDSAKAKTKLGWNPVLGIDETLEWTFEWYKRFYEKSEIKSFTESQIKEFFKRI